MKDTHATRISGAVWFKHKCMTNPAVTPEDCTVAAIGSLAKTLSTKVPPQLRDTAIDKLQKLQEILKPQPIEEQEATLQPASPPAKATPSETAQDPRVASKGAMAAVPRVQPQPSRGMSEFVYPEWKDGVPRKLAPQHVEPQWSPRIAELQKNNTAADTGLLRLNGNGAKPKSGPAQNTRNKHNTWKEP